METRFVLPVTIATALHALVLMVPREPAPEKNKAVDDSTLPPFTVALDEPEHAIEVTERDSKPVRGSSVVPPPGMDEPPPKVNPVGAFAEKVRTVTKVDFDSSKILPEIPGAADGDGEGWSDRPVLDRTMLDNEPHTRSQVSPLYPSELKRLGITGEVWVEFIVDEGGRVLNPHVVRSTDRGFEEATLRAVARWRFEPGRKDGRTVRFRMAVPVVFDLGS